MATIEPQRRRRRRGTLRPESLSQIAKLGESVSKSIAAAAAIVLLAGYVVVSLHFSRLGITSIDFFQPQYVLAGIWALIPFLLVYGSAAALEFGWEQAWPFVRPYANGVLRPFLLIGTFLVVVGTYASFLRFVVIGWLDQTTPLPDTLSMPAFVAAVSFLWPLIHYAFSSLHRLFPRVRPMPVRIGGLLFLLSVGLQGLVVGSLVYIHIPASLGGGGPTRVQFLFDTGFLTASPAPQAPARNYLLYAQTSNVYVARELSGTRRMLVFGKHRVAGYVPKGDVAIRDIPRLQQSALPDSVPGNASR